MIILIALLESQLDLSPFSIEHVKKEYNFLQSLYHHKRLKSLLLDRGKKVEQNAIFKSKSNNNNYETKGNKQ